jgi:hypothetical protein
MAEPLANSFVASSVEAKSCEKSVKKSQTFLEKLLAFRGTMGHIFGQRIYTACVP